MAIMGPSGSGKSTLLNILGCLDRPSSGRYFLGGEDVSRMSDDALSEVRGRRIASRLCDEAEARAAAAGAKRVFLLTETAEELFARRGYRRLDRAAAPPEVAASREFALVCPASAVLMVREL